MKDGAEPVGLGECDRRLYGIYERELKDGDQSSCAGSSASHTNLRERIESTSTVWLLQEPFSSRIYERELKVGERREVLAQVQEGIYERELKDVFYAVLMPSTQRPRGIYERELKESS